MGWFPTGDEINQTPAVIHNMYFTKESQFTATAVLSRPPHLVGQLAHAGILLDQGIRERVHDDRGAAGAVPRGAPHCGNKQE